MRIRDFNPRDGQAFQGDVAIMAIPVDISIARDDEIDPKDNKLILQKGELTGHHHHIMLPRARNFRAPRDITDPVLTTRSTKLRRAFGGKRTKQASVRMYRDASVAHELERRGILAHSDLMVGCLVIEGEPVTIVHQEHDGIRVPPGRYYIGRQIESAGAEERVVAD